MGVKASEKNTLFLDEFIGPSIYEELYNKGTSAEHTTQQLIHTHMTSSSEDMLRLHTRELDMLRQILQRITKHDLEQELHRLGKLCAGNTEPEFLNFQGAQQSIPRNQFRQPVQPGGSV
jgi:hypothetical protein